VIIRIPARQGAQRGRKTQEGNLDWDFHLIMFLETAIMAFLVWASLFWLADLFRDMPLSVRCLISLGLFVGFFVALAAFATWLEEKPRTPRQWRQALRKVMPNFLKNSPG